MLRFMVFTFLFCGLSHGLHDQDSKIQVRIKRNVYQFGRMVSCATNRWASDYIGYGCWCGFGGKGTPVDDTDKCCNVHDLCYKRVHRSGKCSYMGAAYTTIYNRKGCSDCDKSKNNDCQQAVCECDSVAVKCFAKSNFNDKYKRYSQSKC